MKASLFLKMGIVLFLIYMLVLLSLFIFENRFIYIGVPLDSNYSFEDCENIYFETKNGYRLHGILKKSSSPSKGLIFYLHGNSENLVFWSQYMEDFTKRGYDIFMMDYRGYGKSEGRPNEPHLHKDVLQAYTLMRQRYDEEYIILFGRSLGTGPATKLATMTNGKMLLLETPYINMTSVVADFLPFDFLPFELKNSYHIDQWLPNVSMPVHIVHGTKDFLISYDNTRELTQYFKKEDTFTTIKNGEHKNLSSFEEYQRFLDQKIGKLIEK